MRRKLVALGILVLFLAGCATIGFNAKPWSQQTPKERANFMLGIYNAQYDDTMRLATDPLASDAQKQMVVRKKAILKKMRPLLSAYLIYVDHGMTPSVDEEAMLLNLINELANAGGKIG